MSAAAQVVTYVLDEDPALAGRLLQVFGSPEDPVAAVERRATDMLPEYRTILWEGDPQTFQFSYVSPMAEAILGFPAQRWLDEPTFWVDAIVHPDDRDDAVAFCALATGQCRNHDFRYRARTADGRIVTLLDVVQVRIGGRGLPVKLRGLMLELGGDGKIAPRFPRPMPA
jgi:PAS domain-containing protein